MFTNGHQEVEYRRAIVSFIDILGFRALVEERHPADLLRVISQLRLFTQPPEDGGAIGPYDHSAISRAISRSVSDAVVRVRVVSPAQRDGPIFWELLDLLHAQLDLLSRGVLIRAGVTIGQVYASDDPADPVFGPAFNRAFEIESEEAIYPLIAVDRIVLEALQSEPHLIAEGHDYAEERAHIEELLVTADDDTIFLDYLRAGESELDEGEISIFLDNHRRIIEEGWARARTRSVRRKYRWLKNYHNNFLGRVGRAAGGPVAFGESEQEEDEGELPLNLGVSFDTV